MIRNSVSEQCQGTEAMDIRATDNVQDCNSKYDYEGKLAIYVAFKLRCCWKLQSS